MESETIYFNVNRSISVANTIIYMKDVANFYCANQSLTEKIKHLKIYEFTQGTEQHKVISVLYLIQIISNTFPGILAQSLGDTEFIVHYKPETQSKRKIKQSQSLKIALLCFISFFGSAFTIMTYNNDAGVKDLLDYIYFLFMGTNATGNTILHLGYAIGISIGLLFFFNHLAGHRFTQEPTPLEVQMRLYERDVNDAAAIDADRHQQTQETTSP